jgi:hypothetical protein
LAEFKCSLSFLERCNNLRGNHGGTFDDIVPLEPKYAPPKGHE